MDVIGQRFEIGLDPTGMEKVEVWINEQLSNGTAASVIGTFVYNVQKGVYIIVLMAKTLSVLSGFSTGTAVIANQFDVRDTMEPLIDWLNTQSAGLQPPFFPNLTSIAGGSLTGQGTLGVITTLVNPAGETLGSPQATLAVADDHQLVIAPPVDITGTATGWNVYIGTPGNEQLQNQSPLSLSHPRTLVAAPLTGGAVPPVVNSTGYQSIQYIGMVERLHYKLINVVLSNGQFGTRSS